MNLLLGFAPFLAFALVSHLFGVLYGLFAGVAVSAALTLREVLRRRSPKILELGTLLLFGGLSLYTLAFRPQWTLMEVRLAVDLGLLLIVAGSLLVGKPFTSQFAREHVPEEHWTSPQFIETNRRVTGIWAIAFLLLVIADLLLIFVPQLPSAIGIAMTVGALFWAAHRTKALSQLRSESRSPL